ncbi:unnamed protein product [Euphydryas editha]|uniref:Uncharacterized protein n=1 Tax=Euphydryas editha TaxID=104508 RepID=A0AAU9V4Y8_EUPED|nr:unnamed protein product [Euphydryas editha]
MDNKEPNQKINRPKYKTLTSTQSETCKTVDKNKSNEKSLKPRCSLAAKDSEWVDILQTSSNKTNFIENSNEEEEIQLVESESGPQIKPLALMFPDLLQNDPEILEGILNKVMSTTEVTKHLIGHKANFAFMKKVNRLIPTDKKWLESVSECTSCCSMESKSEDDGILLI